MTNKEELVQVFGEPDDTNYNEFFQCYKFFDYADQLVVTRAFEDTDVKTENPPLLPAGLSSERVSELYNIDYTSTNGIATAWLREDNKSNWDNPKFQVGDWISFEPIGGYSVPSEVFIVTSMKYFRESQDNDIPCLVWISFERSSGSIPVSPNIPTPPNVPPTFWDKESYLRLISLSHKNGETHAVKRGIISNYDTVPNPIYAYAADQTLNYDVVDTYYDNGAIKRIECFNDNRLNTMYDLIKSKDDWDYHYAQDTNPLKSSIGDAIIKFWSRTPNLQRIEIAIANWYDFKYEKDTDGNLYNYAVAFQEFEGSNVINYNLNDLFQYYPKETEVAIAIKSGENIETFIVSFDPNAVDGNNKTTYIETVINEQSKYVFALTSIENPEETSDMLPASYLVQDRFGLDDLGQPLNYGKKTYPLIVQGGKSPNITEGALRDAYFTVENKEEYEIDVVIGNEFLRTRNDPYAGDNQNIAIELADSRKDCIAYVGARYIDTVGKKSGEAVNEIVDYILNGDTNSTKLTRTMFGAFFGNYFRIWDNYNNKFRWISCAGDMAGIRCSVSTSNASWWVSAGMKRGIIRGVDKMAFSPSQPQRDILYKNGINPLVTFPGTGHLVWGNKTLLPYASSFDRINTRSLFNTLERAMAKAARSEIFEFNDPYTRNSLVSMFNPYLASVQAGRGITDYLVVCDTTNNTPDVISRNELVCDIYIRPNYAAEFIQLNFINSGTRSFASVIGS